MIRDPSDGTVREEISPEANKINNLVRDSAPKGIGPDTGLRQPIRTDAQERLERSREWLKDYQERKAHARGKADTEAAGGLRPSGAGMEQQSDSDETGR